MSSKPAKNIKTAVYIDGYNLYYGRLRGSSFKWLDVVKLFVTILEHRDQNEHLECVKFFTAHALANFASNGVASVNAQHAYHRGLSQLYNERIEFVYGKHTYDKSGSLLPSFIEGEPYNRLKRSKVWKLEEKKTDVNLAISMYRDAVQKKFDRIILVSNDSDAEPALKAIRLDFPHIMIGVVIPMMPPKPGQIPPRQSGALTNAADWHISHITDEQLSTSQLPLTIPTNKKPILKPSHW